jgi:hypothetical protein
VILVEPPSGFAMLESSFYDQETRGEGEDLFEFMEKWQAIVGSSKGRECFDICA